MSWITVIWSMNAGAFLTLAAFYGAVAVWSKQRKNGVSLLFPLRIMGYGAQCIGGSREVRAAPSKGTTAYRPLPLEAEPSFSTIL